MILHTYLSTTFSELPSRQAPCRKGAPMTSCRYEPASSLQPHPQPNVPLSRTSSCPPAHPHRLRRPAVHAAHLSAATTSDRPSPTLEQHRRPGPRCHPRAVDIRRKPRRRATTATTTTTNLPINLHVPAMPHQEHALDIPAGLPSGLGARAVSRMQESSRHHRSSQGE